MNINVIAGKNSELNNAHIFSILKNRDKTKKHLIVAPDRSLFSIEQRLFSETGEECFFDVSVISLTKLSKTLLGKTNNKILTKQSSVALVKMLLNTYKDELLIFKKSANFIGFASTLFETICLYKSCNITPDEVYVDDSLSYANLKQKDIKLIYTKYEEYLQNDYTDSFNQLKLFADKIDKKFCENTIFYFIEFDDFTRLMYNIIIKLARFSDACYICCTYNKDSANANIYSNKVYYDLCELFKLAGLEISINKLESYKNIIDNILVNNLLAFEPIKADEKCEKIKCLTFENSLDEIKYILANIYKKVIENKLLNFSDFALVLPEASSYIDILKQELDRYDIPFYFDQNRLIINHILVRNLFEILNLISNDFLLSDFTNVLKSQLLDFDLNAVNELDTTLNKIGARTNACLDLDNYSNEEIIEFVNLIKNYRKTIKTFKTNNEFVKNCVLQILELLLKKSEIYTKKLEPLECRVFTQVQNKIQSICDDFLSVFGEKETTITDFIETFKSYFETTNIGLPPITSNTLFIADFNSSYLSTYKYIYILGCNEGKLPKFNLDNGLLTDEEIAKLPNAKKINPTISMLNSRKTFKLFELIFKAKEEVVLSYLTVSNDGKMYPNNLVSSLYKIFDITPINGTQELDIINNSLLKFNKENIIKNNLSKKVAINNILDLVKNWETFQDYPNYRTMIATLVDASLDGENKSLVDNNQKRDYYPKLDNVMMFKENTTSVSQIETFYNCPYKHFVNYGIRLKENKDYTLRPSDIGNIIHGILKQLIPVMVENLDDENLIKTKARELLSNHLKREEFKYIVEISTNDYIIKSLYRELDRVCVGLLQELRASEYRPLKKYLEYSFDPNQIVLNGIKIKGNIDRVDFKDNDFIIIDYKTGDSSFDNYNDVYSGKKLQLLVYAKAFQLESGKTPKGAFYLPLSNSFQKEENTGYKFRGIMYHSPDNFLALDSNLSQLEYKSKIINLSTTKKGEFYKNSTLNNLCLTRDDFDYILDYAIKKVDIAIKNILDGEITPKPIVDDKFSICTYCDYKGLCNYLETNPSRVVTKENIKKIKEEEIGIQTE